MATLTIRNVDAAVKERLRVRAAQRRGTAPGRESDRGI